jgi:hypothetical protein
MNKKKFLISFLLAIITIGAGVYNTTSDAQAARNNRHQGVDDRHNIVNPTANPNRWLETMKRTRVNDLFLTQQGLPGHVRQIQQEINRLTNGTNGLTGAQIVRRKTVLDNLRNSIISSARNSRFDFDKFGIGFHPITSDLYLQRRGNRLWVNGQPDYKSGSPNYGNGPNY